MGFVEDIRKFKEKVEKLSVGVHKNATIGLQEVIMNDTPVLSERLKSNWQATVDIPATTSIYEPVEKLGFVLLSTKYDYNKTLAQSASNLSVIGIDGTTFITNLVGYVIQIEFEGYSAKAPNGMARINIQKWNTIVRKALAKTKLEYG